jgi:hypothetical protein
MLQCNKPGLEPALTVGAGVGAPVGAGDGAPVGAGDGAPWYDGDWVSVLKSIWS